MNGRYGRKRQAMAALLALAAIGEMARREDLRKDSQWQGRCRFRRLESHTAFPDRQKAGERKMGMKA